MLKYSYMFKRLVSYILISILSLSLFAGCSSVKQDVFDAEHFIDECRILVPAAKYTDSDPNDFAINFSTSVFKQFGKSNYYKNMTDNERVEAVYKLGKVLETYSYGTMTDGFVSNFTVNESEHIALWNIKGVDNKEVMWSMPGY